MRRPDVKVPGPVWPENSIRRIPSSTKGYISVRNFGICEPASVQETPRIKQETPKSWTRRIPPARQPFMTDASVAAVTTTRLDRAGEVGHCWFIQPAREISRKRNGSRHFDIGSSHYRRRQGLSPAVSDRSSFRAIRHRGRAREPIGIAERVLPADDAGRVKSKGSPSKTPKGCGPRPIRR